jgi:glyceraldehyde 3-phosphate dehydrogenase
VEVGNAEDSDSPNHALTAVPTGSLVDLTVEVERERGVEDVNQLFRRPRRQGRTLRHARLQRGAARLERRDQLPYSSIFDAGLTTAVDGTQLKVVARYDNEWGVLHCDWSS